MQYVGYSSTGIPLTLIVPSALNDNVAMAVPISESRWRSLST
jgi:hypothetical protein